MGETNQGKVMETSREIRALDLVEHPGLSRCFGAVISGACVFVGVLLAHLYAFSDGFHPLRFFAAPAVVSGLWLVGASVLTRSARRSPAPEEMRTIHVKSVVTWALGFTLILNYAAAFAFAASDLAHLGLAMLVMGTSSLIPSVILALVVAPVLGSIQRRRDTERFLEVQE